MMLDERDSQIANPQDIGSAIVVVAVVASFSLLAPHPLDILYCSIIGCKKHSIHINAALNFMNSQIHILHNANAPN